MKSMMGEPRVVEAGRGASWWSGGYRIFASGVGAWIGIMIIYFIISIVISVIPYVGDVGHWLLTPVFMGGLMIGCQQIERGESLRVAHLFEGFQGTNFVPLMIIGAVNIAIALAIAALAYASILGGMKVADMRAFSGGDPFGAFLGSARAITGTSILVTLLILVIVAVFAMLNWFAPALVALRGATAIEAMKLSFMSCLRNWLPFLVYGLIAIVAGIAVALAMGAIGLVFGAGALMGVGGTAGGIGALLGLAIVMIALVLILALIVGPIVYGSIYESYKDTLGADDTALGNPAYQ